MALTAAAVAAPRDPMEDPVALAPGPRAAFWMPLSTIAARSNSAWFSMGSTQSAKQASLSKARAKL
jgi:hypothetical protein